MKGGTAWKYVASYPLGVFAIRGATLDNRVFMFGKINHQHCIVYHILIPFLGGTNKSSWFKNIYEYDHDANRWIYHGDMNRARGEFGVSVATKSVMDYCKINA